MILTAVAVAFIAAGLVFFLGAAVGLLRFPDFYARMHAAGKGDTLSSLLVIAGFAIYQLKGFEGFAQDWPTILVGLKLAAVVAFIFLTSPTSTSALMDAGWADGEKPVIGKGRKNELGEDSGKS